MTKFSWNFIFSLIFGAMIVSFSPAVSAADNEEGNSAAHQSVLGFVSGMKQVSANDQAVIDQLKAKCKEAKARLLEARKERNKYVSSSTVSFTTNWGGTSQTIEKVNDAAKLADVENRIKQLENEEDQICSDEEKFLSTAKGQLLEYMDSKGAKSYFVFDGTNVKSVTGVTRGCSPLPLKLAEGQSCIFCPLFKTIFNAAQQMTKKSYSALATAISNVMLVGFALWIAFSLLGKVSSFTKMDAPKYITELLIQAFKVIVAYLLLRDASSLYDYLLGPLLKAGMEFGMTLLSDGDSPYLKACNTTQALAGVTQGMIPSYIYAQIECFVRAVQAELSVAQSIGSSLMCVARNAAGQDLGVLSMVVDFRIPDFSMLIQGLVVWVFAWLISLAFAFYLIDATVRLGIIGALMPFLIASWPFKMTSKYTTQGFSMFMNTFFTYVFMGLVVSVNIKLVGESLSGIPGGFEAVSAALNGNQVGVLKDMLDIGFAGFLILIASCIFGFKLTGQATELAGSMAGGGGGTPIAAPMGGMAANVAKAGIMGAGSTAWGGTKILGNATGVTPKLRQAKDKVSNKVASFFGLGRAPSGGASATTPPKPKAGPQAGQPASDEQLRQAEKVRNAEPRPSGTQEVASTSNTDPKKQTTADRTQRERVEGNGTEGAGGNGTTGNESTGGEQRPLTQTEQQNQFIQEFNNTNAGTAIDAAIAEQTAKQAEQRQKIENLRTQLRGANDDARFFDNASRDTKLDQGVRDSMSEKANVSRQKAMDFEREIEKQKKEAEKSDANLNSLNELKTNSSQQYANNKTDPTLHAAVNEEAVINQVNAINK